MKTIIYHCDMSEFPSYGSKEEKIKFALNQDNYEKVASLWLNSRTLQDAKDDAYKITQHGYDEEYPDWVTLAKSYEDNIVYKDQVRSTSIGDIIEINDSKYLVDTVGFIYLR